MSLAKERVDGRDRLGIKVLSQQQGLLSRAVSSSIIEGTVILKASP